MDKRTPFDPAKTLTPYLWDQANIPYGWLIVSSAVYLTDELLCLLQTKSNTWLA